MQLRIYAILIFLWAGPFHVWSQPETVLFDEAADKGATYALVVGIADYENDEIDLDYANRDAEMFALFLNSEAGGNVPNENIKLLVDSMATNGAVLTELRALSKKPVQGDRVIIYFSGHGDVDRDLFEEGYLLTYDTPPNNYYGNAVGVDYLQRLIGALYAKKGVEVILITDACRSGKLAGNQFNGNGMTNQAITQQIPQPTKILSCLADQESVERSDVGGGRGIFSYFLIKGLSGEADMAPKNKVVTVSEIQLYLLSNVPSAAAPKQQIPQIASNNMDQVLAYVNAYSPELMALNDSSSIAVREASDQFLRAKSIIPPEADASVEQLALQFDAAVKTHNLLGGIDSADDLFQKLKQKLTAAELEPFRKQLVIALQDETQQAINNYLTADSAEMAKRMFIAQTFVFDKYPRYLARAAELYGSNDLLYRPLMAKSAYFKAVNTRIKGLIEGNAQKAAQEASQLLIEALYDLKNAAYIHLELGMNYEILEKHEEAEKHYRIAMELGPTWVLPPASLARLYRKLGREVEAIQLAQQAVAADPEYFEGYIQAGRAQEKAGNWLAAETSYRNGLERNMDSYIPFEQLGYLYLKMGRFQLADEMLYEAELRKGLQVITLDNDLFLNYPAYDSDNDGVVNILDSAPYTAPYFRESFYLTLLQLNPQDVASYLTLARHYWNAGNYSLAEQMYREVLALSTQHVEATERLLHLYDTQERYAAYELLLEQAENYLWLDNIIEQQLFLYQDWQRPFEREQIFWEQDQMGSLNNLYIAQNRLINRKWRAYRKNSQIKGYLRLFAGELPFHQTDYWYHLGTYGLKDTDEDVNDRPILMDTEEEMLNSSRIMADQFQEIFLNQHPDYPAQQRIFQLLRSFYTGKANRIRSKQGNYRTERQYEQWKLNFDWQAFRESPQDLDQHWQYIRSLMDNWQYEEVLQRLDSLNEAQLLSSDWIIELGKLKLFAGEHEVARQLLDDAADYFVSLDEAGANWYELQGLWFLAQDESDLARGNFEEAIALNNDDRNNYYQQCRMLASQGELQRALDVLEGAILNNFNYDYVFKYDPKLDVLREWHRFDELMGKYGIEIGQYRRPTRYQ